MCKILWVRFHKTLPIETLVKMTPGDIIGLRPRTQWEWQRQHANSACLSPFRSWDAGLCLHWWPWERAGHADCFGGPGLGSAGWVAPGRYFQKAGISKILENSIFLLSLSNHVLIPSEILPRKSRISFTLRRWIAHKGLGMVQIPSLLKEVNLYMLAVAASSLLP